MAVELREISPADADLRAYHADLRAGFLEHTLPPEQHEFAATAYVQQRLPAVGRVVLGANHRNPGAVAAYLRGGFVMTGEDYLGGFIGPQ